jgi:tetratricopeptide (TPR) repeat protein
MRWIAKSAGRILALNQSLESNPRQADLFRERAAEYARLGNHEQAIADYSSSLGIRPDDARSLQARGLAYAQVGQTERSLEDYRQAAAVDSQLSNEYINRGVALGRMGNFRQSIDSMTEGIRLAPENPDGYFNRGTTYIQQGDFDKAVDDFSHVIQLSPKDEAAYYWRGISHEEAGRRREAIADYRQFLAISQDAQARQEVEQRLRQWNVEAADSAGIRGDNTAGGQNTAPAQQRRPDRGPDLYELIAALGKRALDSTWSGSGVDCDGEKAEELYALTDRNRPIPGRDLLQIASGIRQTIQGDFQAFDADADSPWVFIRAWEGNGFYIETNDPKSRERLKTRFPSVEEVEGASPPYVGLFIHTPRPA